MLKLYIFGINLPCMAFVTPRYLSPVSTVSATNAWDYDPLFGAPTHEKKKERKLKKRLHFLSLAAKASETENCIYIFTTKEKDRIKHRNS